MSASDDDFSPFDPLEEAVRLAADMFVFAPLGLLLSAREVMPTIVERGRRQVRSANTIGKFVVPIARRKAKQKVHETVERLRTEVETMFDRDSGTSTNSDSATAWDSDTDVAFDRATTRNTERETVVPSHDAPEPQPEAGETSPRDRSRIPPSRRNRSISSATESNTSPSLDNSSDLPGRTADSATTIADSSGLGIANFDTLPATTILDLLAGLSVHELTEIDRYERSHRGRRTVLHAIQMRLSAS